jgi:hypothetical protein
MYLPYITSGALASSGKLTSTVQSDVVAGWAAIFNDLNTIDSASGRTDPMGVVILSKAAGATFEVLHVAIDDHFDAQRRRQHQSPATVVTADVTAW